MIPEWKNVQETFLDERSMDLRRTILRMLSFSRRGHLGAAFSLVEILRVLYDHILHYDSGNPSLPNRDRCILSKGHGCLALYTVLEDKGFFPEKALWEFCGKDAILGGHPEHGRIPGVEASTGSLGHGLSMGIGFAINARLENLPYRVFVIVGDGESNEGSIWEGALCAGKYGLDHLTVIIDYNRMQSYGPVAQVQELEPFADKWRSFGFGVVELNGHDTAALSNCFASLPMEQGKPSAIICHTVKGMGIKSVENNPRWHHKSHISDREMTSLFKALEARS